MGEPEAMTLSEPRSTCAPSAPDMAVNPVTWTGSDPRDCGEATTMAAGSR